MILFGNLGSGLKVNGQVVKTKEVILLLQDIGFSFDIFDTSIRNPFSFFIKIMLNKSDNHFICLGRKGIVLYFLTITLFFLKPPNIFIFSVGGWLPNLMKKWWMKIITFRIRLQTICFVESESMIPALFEQGFKAFFLPNFRSKLELGDVIKKDTLTPLNLIFLSRLIPEKGIDEAISLVNQLNSIGKTTFLDIYGVGSDRDLENLKRKVSGNNFISYQGSVCPAQSSHVISKYHFLILPTRYYGECMPGVVVEALSSGTPVLTTDWLYMPEMVIHNFTGGVFGMESFCGEALEWLSELNYIKYEGLQKRCLDDFRLRFSYQTAKKIMTRYVARD
jgi:glycosyltransferase involved in cell wall biosynthesis